MLNLFDEIVIIPEASKASALDLLIRKEQPISAVFIDDKKEVLEDVKKNLPSVYVVQIRRDMTVVPARHIDISVHDFDGLRHFIYEWKESATE